MRIVVRGCLLKDSRSISGVCQPISLYPCNDMSSEEMVYNRLTVSHGRVAKFNGYYGMRHSNVYNAC